MQNRLLYIFSINVIFFSFVYLYRYFFRLFHDLSHTNFNDGFRLQRFRNKYKGKRCFIIGNGPSLNKIDLSLLKNEYTFGLNRIYLNYKKMGFYPTFYVSVNKLLLGQCWKEIRNLPMPKFIAASSRSLFRNSDNSFFIRSEGELFFSKYISMGISEGATVTYTAMQIAYFMGFSEVVLVGVDHSFNSDGKPGEVIYQKSNDLNHFSARYFKGKKWQLPDLATSELAYRIAKHYFEKDGRKIFDATVGGKLKVFEKIPYKKILKNKAVKRGEGIKIGIQLINYNPNYRGGLNSYIEGLISGLIKEDEVNDYYILVYQRNKKYYQKYIGKNFHIITFPDPGQKTFIFNYYLLMIFTAPLARKLYFYLESVLYKRLISQINNLELDMIYSPSVPFFPMRIKGKLIVSPHDIQQFHFPQYFTLWERWMRATAFTETFKKADIIQASSDFMKNEFHRYMRAPLNKVVVIPEGVMDLFLKFRPKLNKSKVVMKKFDLKPGYLFYPAQHWKHKNHITLLKAIMWINKKYLMDVKVVFTGEKQPKFSYLYNFVEENGLNDSVKFVGNVKFSELFYLYHNASIVVVPGGYESSSLPVREAMALGKPIIAARNGSNEEINLDNNIVLFATYNYKDLANKIVTLTRDRNAGRELIRKSKRIVMAYRWENVARKYIDIYG